MWTRIEIILYVLSKNAQKKYLSGALYQGSVSNVYEINKKSQKKNANIFSFFHRRRK